MCLKAAVMATNQTVVEGAKLEPAEVDPNVKINAVQSSATAPAPVKAVPSALALKSTSTVPIQPAPAPSAQVVVVTKMAAPGGVSSIKFLYASYLC